MTIFCRFMKRCREATTHDPKAKHYMDILLSSVEYDTFVKLMRLMRPVAQQRLMSTESDAKSTGDAKFDSPSKAAKEVAEGPGSISKAESKNDREEESKSEKGSK